MSFVKLVYALVAALPELMALVKEIEARADERALAARVKEDVRKINDAFKSRDTEALNAVFRD